MNLKVALRTVSYTHLDVYKRQELAGVVPRKQPGLRRNDAADPGNPDDSSVQVPGQDVYKRQDPKAPDKSYSAWKNSHLLLKFLSYDIPGTASEDL